MKSKLPVLLVAVGVLISGVPAIAHHSFTATYRGDEVIEIRGRIVQFLFRNPHSWVHVMVSDENDVMQRWAVEWGALASS
ncbi:MAG: DUF6152 family protein [Gammaproteobacteria bacterium]